MFLSEKKIFPEVGFYIRAIKCNKVDLPDPEGPVRAISSPFLIEKFKFFKTSIFPF